MQNKRCVIVVPIYKEYLNIDDKMSLQHLIDVLDEHDICFVCPKSIVCCEIENFHNNHTSTWKIDDLWMKSRDSYGKLCNSTFFYQHFKDLGYEYMLIYQLDAWVFRDELDYWCEQGYDYIGAPFFVHGFMENNKYVGNGGFSLRKLDSMINYINANGPKPPHYGGDDGYFVMNYGNMLNFPTKEIASEFSLEVFPTEQFQGKTKLPFGCHAYKKYDWPFWKDKIEYDAYSDLRENITFCILTYKETENAKTWYRRFKDYFNTYIIDTFVLDNNVDNPYEKEFPNDEHIILEHNVYNGGQRQIAYKKAVENNSEWMVTVDADVEMKDVHSVSKMLVSMEKLVNSNDIGIYEVSAEHGSKCQGSTNLILQNLHLYNQGTNSFRQVEEGEGWYRAVRMDIANKIYPYQNFEDNKYGWGGECNYYLAKQMGLKTVIDDTFSLYHPAGVSYNNQEAVNERERFFKRFPELGIEIPKHKSPAEIKTLLCCIGKNENRYIRDYVEWYKNLGVTHICLYDNNDVDGERFESVIGDYIESGYVELVDFRGREVCQLQAYTECYHNNKNDYDWIMFIDCGDEYLKLNRCRTIGEYLAMPQFVNYDMIHVNLMTVGDNDSTDVDDRPLWERFPNPIPFDRKIAYNFPENCHVSSIVRGGLEDIKWEGNGFTHTPSPNNLRCCNNVGFTCDSNSPFTNIDYQLAEFRHYTTKTAREYCNKMRRGFPDQKWDGSRIQNLIETRFFRTNEITKEKVDIFKQELGIDMSYLLPHVYEGSKNDDVKIYSLCYAKKDFKFLEDSVVTPLQVGAANGTEVCDLKDNVGDNISDKNYLYIENTGTYWIWKNVHDCKYKGQMQYRRPLSGVTEEMDFDKVFEDYDVITCEPFYHPDHKTPTETEKMVIPADTVEQGYAFSNCIDDLLICEMAVKMLYPEYSEDWDKYIKNGPNLYYSNGFIMKTEDYDRYCDFLFKCLDMYLQFSKIHDKQSLEDHVRYNLEVGKYPRYQNPKQIPQEAVRWQMSILGFLSERLWTLWLQHNFNEDRIYKTPYIKMEENMYT